ncbi:hypothetical protein BS47DRAFT_1305914 [Hydnum rufescens UP504]|uniref:DNA replication complex GINS protein SLD5 n=1 Tax=Hydnum rufescens UP504 TaxID=1448309 RepID=A0A9P6AIJ6_9AGAM|nr:hypothetical protein BS47DRAFT_1305914 [Hydnum rufescens UP504]
MEDGGDDGRRPQPVGSPGSVPRDLDRELDRLDDERMLDKLTRYWIDERNSPDILVWQGLVVEETLDKLQAQAEMVQKLQEDPRTSEEEHFRIVLIQTEAERVKFLVRSYLRTRLHKIEKYAAYIIQTPEMRGRLSVTELAHAQKYHALLTAHFHSSALSGLPESMRSLDDDEDESGRGTVTRPNKAQGLFIRARRRCPVSLPNGGILELEKGAIHLIPYEAIEALLRLGDVECL